jgi:hypothetical protein
LRREVLEVDGFAQATSSRRISWAIDHVGISGFNARGRCDS